MNEQDPETEYPVTRGFGEVPFSQARPSRALLEEDAFMEAHGDDSCRACGFIEKALWLCGKAVWRIIRRIVKPKTPQATRRSINQGGSIEREQGAWQPSAKQETRYLQEILKNSDCYNQRGTRCR